MKFSTVLESNVKTYSFKKVVLMSSLLVFLFSCNFNNEKVVCEVGGFELTEEMLNQLILLDDGSIENDDDREKALNEWVDKQLIKLEIAEKIPKSYSVNKLKTEDELGERNLFDLENQYIRENLDSTVSDEEIQEYYDKHRENYVSKSYIVRALYLKVSDTIGEHNKLAETFLLKNDKDKDEIKKYGNLYATNFYFEESKWIYFEDLIRDIPIVENRKNKLIVNKEHSIYKEGGFTHYINILDYRLKEISSPMEFEKKLIQKHILKRRINELRETAKETILENVREKYKVNYR
ncbi:MAG: hypothetical protein WED10_10435 [Brumimicrobium sp.]